MTKEEFIDKAVRIHGNKYDYSKVPDYVCSKMRKSIIYIGCSVHGYVETSLQSHIYKRRGCGRCSGKVKMSNEEFLKKANDIHCFKYEYPELRFNKMTDKIKIICPTHGMFYQQPKLHVHKKQGCPECGKSIVGNVLTKEELLNRFKCAHEDKYDYSLVEYANSTTKVAIKCRKHGVFYQYPRNHSRGNGCSKCSHQVSKGEKEIFDFVSSFLSCEQSNRKMLENKELDIFIPELKVGIEYHGLYFHSDKFREKSYHLDKLLECEEKGIRLIQIFEDEWRDKKEICKSRLLNLLNFTSYKIFARKCEIREVSAKDAREFLEINHIQGNVNSKVKLGLYHNNELVSLMTFGSLRKNLGQTAKEGSYELLRFCNKLNTNVVGGASKLLSYFEKNFHPSEIISYADRRWSDGNLYKQLNFELVSTSQPNYFYVNRDVRENRFKYRKSELVKQGFDPNKTEKEIMEEEGFVRIYDCGTMKFVKRYN